jgi:hypothetical protein
MQSETDPTSIQPELYSTDTSLIRTLTYNLQLVFAVLAAVAVLGYLLLSSNQLALLKDLDLFKKCHNHFADEVMYIRKKPIGGLASLLFLLTAALFIITALASFSTNNVEEAKALVPMVTLEAKYPEIRTNLHIGLKYSNLPNSCQANDACASTIKVGVYGFGELTTVTCSYAANDCTITMECSDCLIATGAFVSFESTNLKDYATAIYVNVTCTSSIPDEISSVAQQISPSYKHIFKGHEASLFYFEVTPSVRAKQLFLTDSAQWPTEATGYHVSSVKSTVVGSQAAVSR